MKPLRRRFLFPPLLVLLAACGSPFTDPPPVADSTLISALAELHLAEARLDLQRQGRLGTERPPASTRPDTASIPLPPALRDSILARHGLSYRQLRAALTYYSKHPEQYTELYSRVVDTLNAENSALRARDARSAPPPEPQPTPPAFR